ncbi:MAG: hypothetical protein HYR96_05120 [Deltaproteobacteria bacterium]|nr:hypothetical protein [Deltaproteobacteria bacterium]
MGNSTAIQITLAAALLTAFLFAKTGSFDEANKELKAKIALAESYVWDYCLNWIGNRVCERWLDPYVAMHGMTAERSPLEAAVAQAWMANEKKVSPEQYKIWNVKAEGSVTDVDGKLDRGGLSKWELTSDVKKQVEQVGTNTANRQMSLTYDEDAEERKGNTMPNMESLRTMASRWTKMFRNRLVTVQGETRSAQQPIQFMLGEDKADCDAYLIDLKRDPDPMGVEERIRVQPLLDPLTRAEDLERRYNLCIQMKRQSVYAVNPTIQGDQVKPGSKEAEAIDSWRIRANIAAIDYAGIDPNSLPKPSKLALSKEDISSDVADYEVGGKEYQINRQTNAEQIGTYNQAVADSAARVKALSVLSPNLPSNDKEVNQWQIKTGSMNLVELNGLTPEMKQELKGTRHPAAEGNASPPQAPERDLETTPMELTVKAAH